MFGKLCSVYLARRHGHEDANRTSIFILGQGQEQICSIDGLQNVSLTIVDMAQLRKTDIDVGRDLMAAKRGGCAIVFSQPSCRTIATRRPGPGWRMTFGTRNSLQQS
jgi:hypothetical protein